MAQIAKGKTQSGIFVYLNDLDKLCAEKSLVKTVAQFMDIDHLEKSLAVRAAWSVRDVTAKLLNTKAAKKVLINDLFA
jgi:hypothetical protein